MKLDHVLIDPVKLAGALRLEYMEQGRGKHHHVRRGWVGFHCVLCGDHSGFKLAYNEERGFWACWRCGPHSTWRVVSAWLRTKDPTKIGPLIAQCASARQVVRRQLEALLAERLREPPGMGPLGRLHHRYLESRGFDAKALAREWGLRGTKHLSGRWSWRVVAPIHESSGRPVAYVGRAIRSKDVRYLESKAEECLVRPEALLYGVEKATGDSVVVVEGPADVWRLGPGAVATRGTSWRRAQANLLRHYKRRFILYDPEPLAQRKALALARYLAMFQGETEVVTGFRTDPGAMSEKLAARVMRDLGVQR